MPQRTHAQFTSDGHRLFVNLRSPDARRLGVSRQMLSGIRHGRKQPGPVLREALEREYAIPAGAWDRRPSPDTGSPEPERQAPGPADELDGLIGQLQAERQAPGLAPTTLARLASAELAARRQRDAKTSDLARIVASPQWLAIEAAIVKSLENFPAAKVAVVEALKGVT